MQEEAYLKKVQRLTFEDFKEMAKNQDLSNHEKIGFPDNYRCLLYTSLFPETFLYLEEGIFTLLQRKVNIKSFFTTNTFIIHKEDQTGKLFGTSKIDKKRKYESVGYKYLKEIENLSYYEIMEKYLSLIHI